VKSFAGRSNQTVVSAGVAGLSAADKDPVNANIEIEIQYTHLEGLIIKYTVRQLSRNSKA
jgi:hypothetical protein